MTRTTETIRDGLIAITVLLIAPALGPWVSEIIARWITG